MKLWIATIWALLGLTVNAGGSTAGTVVKMFGNFPSTNRTYTIWFLHHNKFTTAFNAVVDDKGRKSLSSAVTVLGTPNIVDGYPKSFGTLPILRVVDLVRGETTEGGKTIPLSDRERRKWKADFKKIDKIRLY